MPVNLGQPAARIVEVTIGAVMLLAVGLNFANVVGRYVFLKPLFWGEEVMLYGMIWVVMLGAPVLALERAHLKMEAIYDLLPAPLRRAVDLLIALVTLGMAAYVAHLSTDYVQRLAATGQRSVAAGIPMVLPFAAIPVGFGLMIVALLVRLRTDLHREAARRADVAPMPPTSGHPE